MSYLAACFTFAVSTPHLRRARAHHGSGFSPVCAGGLRARGRISPGRASQVVFLLIPVLLTGACDRRQGNPGAPLVEGPSGESAAGGSLSPEEVERAALEGDWKRLQATLEAGAGGGRARLAALQLFIARAARFADRHGIGDFALLRRAESALEEARTSFELEAKTAFFPVKREVEAIIRARDAVHSKAEMLIAAFRRDKLPQYEGTGLKDEVDALERKVALYRDSEMQLLRLTGRIEAMGDDYVTIIALLEGFAPEFEETPSGEKVRELVDQYMEKYREVEAGQTRVDDLPAREWAVSKYEIWSAPEDEPAVFYSEDDDVLTVGPNPSGFEYKDSQGTIVILGSGRWIDAIITMEVRVTDPSRAFLAARGYEDYSGGIRFTPVSLGEFDMAEDEWYALTLVVEGSRFDITSTSISGRAGVTGLVERPGYLVFQVLGEEARISVRNVQYKVTVLEEDEARGEREDGGESDGSSSGEEEGPDGDEGRSDNGG